LFYQAYKEAYSDNDNKDNKNLPEFQMAQDYFQQG
jgi:hypothetical protein